MSIIDDRFSSSDFELNFEYLTEFLYTYVGKGYDSLEVSKSYWFRALEECKSKNYEKLLIEEDLEGNLSTNESYQLSVLLAESEYKDILVAFVDTHIEHQDLNRFGELIVTNRGARIKVFNDKKEAKEWLLSN